jgi:hypothetical protein
MVFLELPPQKHRQMLSALLPVLGQNFREVIGNTEHVEKAVILDQEMGYTPLLLPLHAVQEIVDGTALQPLLFLKER